MINLNDPRIHSALRTATENELYYLIKTMKRKISLMYQIGDRDKIEQKIWLLVNNIANEKVNGPKAIHVGKATVVKK